MKIGIDARFFGPRQKGLGRYVQKLVENLEKINSDNQYVIFLRKDNWPLYQPKNQNFKKVLADYKWYGFKEQILMPFRIWLEKIDLMHFPHFNASAFCPVPFVVTIHDLVLRKFPTRRGSTLGPIFYWLKNLAYRLVIWLNIKRAKKIITVSNYTKQDILSCFKVRPRKIKMIYEGSPKIKNSNVKIQIINQYQNQNVKCKNKLQKFKIIQPYLLYVGNAYPHKNLNRLVSAFRKLIEDDQMDLQLVLAGELDFFYKKLQNKIKSSESFIPSYKRIVFTDFVRENDLGFLYQNAELYIFPSLCEGFGLPPLEAMACGLPVVSSSAASLPEILGPAALYFNPEDIDEMAKVIKRGLKDRNLRKQLTISGFKQIKKYNWLKMAENTLELYQSIRPVA